jgi:iron(III) transport system permease protein
VIAVGVLIPVTRLDQWLAGQWQDWFGENPGLLLTGGIAALVYAYLVRFLAVALQSVGSSLAKITANMDDAARSLGLGQALHCGGCTCRSCVAACSPPVCWCSSTS